MRQLKGVEGSMLGVERASVRMTGGMSQAHLSTGRLRQELVSLVRQATGTNPVVAQLGSLLSEFAVGGPVTLGVLGGVGAIVGIYSKLTEGARAAAKANRELIDSLAKSNFTAALGPDPDLVLQTNAQRNELRQQQSRRRTLLNFGVSPDDERILELDRQIAQATKELADGEERLFKARMAAGKALDTVTVTAHDFKADAAKVAAAALQANKDFWNLQNRIFGDAKDAITNLSEDARQFLLNNPSSKLGNIALPEISMPNVDLNDSLTREQIKVREKMGIFIEDSNRNAQMLHDVIANSAIQGASIIVNALNIGGGGKGSGLGGALGSTAGFAVGFGLTGGNPIGGAIGATVGQIAGSLFGGLFDHNKKAVNANTQAVRENTAMMAQLLNAPSVYKVARDRFDATQVKDFRRSSIRYATRGGAPILVTP